MVQHNVAISLATNMDGRYMDNEDVVTIPTATAANYKSLEEGSVRLVRFLPCSTSLDIHCSLECYTLGSKQEKYKALSYCWGDPNTTRQITLNGSPFRVTMNLWTALSSIVQYHDVSRLFWIDAICINQVDITERNHEVKRMWQIFSGAEHVYAWLGAENDYTGLAWQTMRRLARGCQANIDGERSCGRPSKNHKRMSAVAVLATYLHASCEYFTRAWTIVEAINARKISILCGRFIIDASVFRHAVLVLQPQRNNIPFPDEFMNFIIARNRAAKRGSDALNPSGYADLYETFSLFMLSRSSDPRDKIFAMLSDTGLRGSGMPIADLGPNYHWTVDELALIVLEFRSKMLQYESRPDRYVEIPSMVTLDQLGIAFGTPRNPPEFRAWFHGHTARSESWRSDKTVTTGTGRRIDCPCHIIDFLLDERNTKFTRHQWLRSNSGGPDSITQYVGAGMFRRETFIYFQLLS